MEDPKSCKSSDETLEKRLEIYPNVRVVPLKSGCIAPVTQSSVRAQHRNLDEAVCGCISKRFLEAFLLKYVLKYLLVGTYLGTRVLSLVLYIPCSTTSTVVYYESMLYESIRGAS